MTGSLSEVVEPAAGATSVGVATGLSGAADLPAKGGIGVIDAKLLVQDQDRLGRLGDGLGQDRLPFSLAVASLTALERCRSRAQGCR